MKIILEIKETKSGWLVSGATDDKAIEADVATTKRQAANLAKRVVLEALGEVEE